MVLSLNGSDVTGHGKVSLSKMIGYLPRPLIMTLTLPPPVEAGAPAPADVSFASQPVAQVKEKAKLGLKKGKKSARHVKKSPREKQDADGGGRKGSVESAKGLEITGRETETGQSGGEVVGDAVEAAESADSVEVRDQASRAGSRSSSPQAQRRGSRSSSPALQRRGSSASIASLSEDKGSEADGEEGDGDAEPDAGEEGSDSPPEGWRPGRRGAVDVDEDDAIAMPTGESAPAPAEAAPPAVEQTKPTMPQKAHPPPAAPLEAFPPWATQPPPRSPRHVAGTNAKYVLKPTIEAFNHPSLVAPPEKKKERRQSVSREAMEGMVLAEQPAAMTETPDATTA